MNRVPEGRVTGSMPQRTRSEERSELNLPSWRNEAIDLHGKKRKGMALLNCTSRDVAHQLLGRFSKSDRHDLHGNMCDGVRCSFSRHLLGLYCWTLVCTTTLCAGAADCSLPAHRSLLLCRAVGLAKVTVALSRCGKNQGKLLFQHLVVR